MSSSWENTASSPGSIYGFITFDHFYVSKAPNTFSVLPRPKQKENKIELQISEKADHDKKNTCNL